ncbi:conserved exported protein of unknown function [Methylacidimicrobium sp. AP8]|uniref:hypothetical protein n=1 Tax=Methylacidimicrobium sp. AP8 TaxID=2730359 RepID=UPI0018C0C28F|nr:hypothetical protein [Methylacidimicrobium sp. AP8]CAB4244647.1 conserved exported protein of unknown function [Methylacidimicrobium sp. AP8]
MASRLSLAAGVAACFLSLASVHGEERPPVGGSPGAGPDAAPAPAPPAEAVAPAQPVLPPPQQAPEPLVPPPGVQVEEFIGHRTYDKDGSGWGWVRRVNEPWSAAKWVVLKETPGGIVAPWRLLKKKPPADNDVEYRLRGYLAPFTVYDPHTDEFLAVFVPERVEPIGPASPPPEHPGAPSHRVRMPDSASAVNAVDPTIQVPSALR